MIHISTQTAEDPNGEGVITLVTLSVEEDADSDQIIDWRCYPEGASITVDLSAAASAGGRLLDLAKEADHD